jgi:hypothetical protein
VVSTGLAGAFPRLSTQLPSAYISSTYDGDDMAYWRKEGDGRRPALLTGDVVSLSRGLRCVGTPGAGRTLRLAHVPDVLSGWVTALPQPARNRELSSFSGLLSGSESGHGGLRELIAEGQLTSRGREARVHRALPRLKQLSWNLVRMATETASRCGAGGWRYIADGSH